MLFGAGFKLAPERKCAMSNRCCVGHADGFAHSKLALAEFFDPADFIGKDWRIWKGPVDGNGLEGMEDRDAREDNLKVLVLQRLILEACCQGNKMVVEGEERLLRLKTGKNVTLGGKVFLALWKDYQFWDAEFKPEESILENIRLGRKATHIYFFGLVLRHPRANRCILCLYFDDKGWHWNCTWLVGHLGINDFSIAY